MSVVYVHVREMEVWRKTLRRVLSYGVMFNVTKGLLGTKMFLVSEDRILSVEGMPYMVRVRGFCILEFIYRFTMPSSGDNHTLSSISPSYCF